MFVCLYLFIFIEGLLLVKNWHKLCVEISFFLSLSLYFNANEMSVRGKGGKLLGEGRGSGLTVDGDCLGQGGKGLGRGVNGQGAAGGSRDDIIYPARDIRTTGRGGQGSGQVNRQGGARPRRKFSCSNCQDNFCGLARELVRVVFKMGRLSSGTAVGGTSGCLLARWLTSIPGGRES